MATAPESGTPPQHVIVDSGSITTTVDTTGLATSTKQDTQQTALDAIAASAGVLDDWDESDRAKVNPIAGQAGVAGGSGTVSALTQRVVLATDVALPAGTNALGTVTAKREAATTATLSNVASSASNVTLLASNANRRGMALYNDSTATLYMKFGATATSSSFTALIPTLTYYEMPEPIYTGIIDGIWASANGSARLTEYT